MSSSQGKPNRGRKSTRPRGDNETQNRGKKRKDRRMKKAASVFLAKENLEKRGRKPPFPGEQWTTS